MGYLFIWNYFCIKAGQRIKTLRVKVYLKVMDMSHLSVSLLHGP